MFLNCFQILRNISKGEESQASSIQRLSPLDMVRRGYLLTTSVLIVGWVFTNVGSYTLTFNATRLAGDIFTNFLFTVLANTPIAFIFYFTLDRFGRKWNFCVSECGLGLACLVLAFIPKDYPTAILVVFCLGKMTAGAAFMMVWLYTVELYPTNLRTQAIGTCSTVARLFGLACPFISNLAAYWKPLPMVMLGVPTFIVGVVVFLLLPETAGKDLPQNLEDGIELNKRQKR